MGKVVAQAIMSLDGYVAKQDNTIGRLFDWLQNGEVEIPTPAGDFAVHLTPPSSEHWRRWVSSLGALVCGRTLFDLQPVTDQIKSVTGHLTGVKIAIMGCIVNGLGEMADADFGYVGSSPGKINLYVGKECVEKGVPAAVADARLIDLIRRHGKWVDVP